MLEQALLVAHIAVLGYWLGAEFVINSSYRYVCYATGSPFAERDRLMEHVMHVDQHVRYALVLQAALGTALAAAYGYLPGGNRLVTIALLAGAGWLVFVELVHRLRHSSVGPHLAAVDRGSRYLLMALLVAVAAGLIGGDWPMPAWLRLKLVAFAGVMASGVGIRLALTSHFRTWALMRRDGADNATNTIIKRTYIKATSVLLLLWLLIGVIVLLSVAKPG